MAKTPILAGAAYFFAGIAVQAASVAAVAADAAETQRYTDAVTPLLDAAGGKPIGSLQPGIAVEALGQSGAATHITVHGWSAQGANAAVFAAPTRRIVLVSGYSGPAQGATSQTVNGAVYQEVTVDGWVTAAALVDDVQVVWKRAAALFADKCGGCHALPDINSIGVNQWPAIMKTQAANAGLDANENALLTTYLQMNTTR